MNFDFFITHPRSAALSAKREFSHIPRSSFREAGHDRLAKEYKVSTKTIERDAKFAEADGCVADGEQATVSLTRPSPPTSEITMKPKPKHR
ncbi:MAG: hypothetical protein AAF543_16135, partial [Pseudomonadota bacterium]